MTETSKIIQIIPTEDTWVRYIDRSTPDTYFYSKAECLALIEFTDKDTRYGEMVTRQILPIDFSDDGIYEEQEPNFDGLVRTTQDLSEKTCYITKHGKEIKK